MTDSRRPDSDARGLTTADRDRIAAYLQKPAHSRCIDDLRGARED